MRERILLVLVGLTAVVIGVLGVTRAYVLAGMVQRSEAASLERVATLASATVGWRVEAGDPVTSALLATLVTDGERVTYRSGATTVTAGGPVDAREAHTATRSVPGGGTLTVEQSDAVVDHRISEAVVPLAVLGLGLMALSAAAASVLARRLARPFTELAEAARLLGSGRFSDLRIPHYAIPEAENIGEALRVSAARLDHVLQREREFAANASHQLRTPITAMRLQLEDLAQWPQTHPLVAEELGSSLTELDRLNDAVGRYLDLARGRRRDLGSTVDLAGLARDVVARHHDAARRAGRVLVVDAPAPVPTQTHPDTVDQLLDVLVDNALAHGRGTVTVAARDEGDRLVLRVADEGSRPTDPGLFRRGASTSGSTGLGLSLATTLAHSIDARVELTTRPRTTFEVRLPR